MKKSITLITLLGLLSNYASAIVRYTCPENNKEYSQAKIVGVGEGYGGNERVNTVWFQKYGDSNVNTVSFDQDITDDRAKGMLAIALTAYTKDAPVMIGCNADGYLHELYLQKSN